MTTEEFHRKLTAILSADVQGYSRLMGEDEESTVRTLTAYRTLMSSLIRGHRGQVVDTIGDNLLAKFDSGTDAVRCAVEIQEELRIRNVELPEHRRMLFRIGINLGDVIEEGDRIYGDGINVAARIEGLAEGGGICISGFVYGAIKNKLSLSYEFIGEHSVKNIKDPVRVYRIRMEPEDTTPKAPAVKDVGEEPKTIAVLPFMDLSPEKDQEYFVDGLTEELLNSLAKIKDLQVIARTSSFAFKGTAKTVQEITDVLGANHILEGSVRKAGNSLRITAQLIRAADGIHLWSETYNRQLKDIFEVQEDIATAVADELTETLGIKQSFRQQGATDNVEAYTFYMVAQGQIANTEYSRAMASLNSALAIDPDFALAWASKATIYIFNTVLGPTKDVALEREDGLHAATKAINLAPNLAAGYFALGYVKTTGGNFIEGKVAYRKALELSDKPPSFIVPVVAINYQAVGYFDKERKLLEEMLQSDPLNQGTYAFYIPCLGYLNENEKAEETYKLAKALFGDAFGSYNPGIMIARLGSGKVISPQELVYSDPVVEAMKTHLDSPKEGIFELRRLYAHADDLSAMSLATMALGAAYFGDSEFSLEVLENAVGNVAEYVFMLWQPVMRKVRQLPRFKEFIREIGLVDYWERFGWPDLCHPTDDGDFVCD